MKGFIIYPTYYNQEDKTIVQLFGKLENGESFVASINFEPYFFIKTSDKKKVSKYLNKFKLDKTILSNFQDSPVLKIMAKNQTDLNKLYEAIHKKVDTYEADIKPQFRFLMDQDLLGNINIEGDYESSERIDRVYTNPKISKEDSHSPKLKIASIDIEASNNTNQLICIGIHSDNYQHNFYIAPKNLSNPPLKNTTLCKSEAECLNKFKSALIKLDPDIITGWNVIDFDLKYLQSRFHENHITFDLGRTNEETRIKIQSNFFRSSTAIIPGRVMIDALNLIRDPFIQEAPSIKGAKFKSYTLEDVSQSILNSGKLIKGKGAIRHNEIEKLYSSKKESDHQKLIDYNLLDCKLVYDILKKSQTIELAIERSQLTGMPLDKISGSIASFDSLYIREARKKGLVSPTLRFGLKEERITGGYVAASKPGIYNNVLVLDFKSLYPSILQTFNIDPASLLEKKQKDAIISPNKVYFKNQSGVLPVIISRLHKAREKAKSEKRELSSYAIKIIMNSFWGVLASPSCRYFNFDMANAITGFGRFIIQLTAKEIEKLGYKTIYSDTDSVFVLSNTKDKNEALQIGNIIQEHINTFYKNYTKKQHNRLSYLELEFEKLYLSLMMPQTRNTETAAKKRYAGLIYKDNKEKLEVVGLESIRGDWTEAAKEFQLELLDKVFHDEPIEKYINSYIMKLQQGKLDEKLIYKKSIRKNLSEYTKTTPPHVKAARKLPSLDSNLIQYYITEDGPEPIQKLKHKLDYNHYIEKQIRPIAQQVLILIGKDFDDVVTNSKQAKLF
jgi:DNA polymerase II